MTLPLDVTIKRPTTADGSYGEVQGKPEVIAQGVTLRSMRTLNAREREYAQHLVPVATHRIEIYGNPAKPLKHRDWLELGNRKLEIAEINDRRQNGIELELLCGEVVE